MALIFDICILIVVVIAVFSASPSDAKASDANLSDWKSSDAKTAVLRENATFIQILRAGQKRNKRGGLYDVCPGDSVYCRGDCCNIYLSACCDIDRCVEACQSIFEVVPCSRYIYYTLNPYYYHNRNRRQSSPVSDPFILYRVIRDDENPSAIVARAPNAQRSVLSHVNCAGRPTYRGSQFISFTTSLDVALTYHVESGGNRIVRFVVDDYWRRQFTMFVDLNNDTVREQYLGRAVCRHFARASHEVVISCPIPIVTEEMTEIPHDELKK